MEEKILGYGEIQLKDICLNINGKKILKNISVELKAGKIHVFFGKSGSGKTSLMNVLNGLYIPTEGEYYFESELVNYEDEAEISNMRMKIGYFHQELALMEHMTLEENMQIFSQILGKRVDEKVLDVQLENLGLKSLYQEDVSYFSGGERQRAAFLKLLLFEYPVVLIDEPTNNLDAENIDYMIRAMKQLREEGKNVIVVSHSERILEIADIKYYMEEINEAE